MGHLWLLCILMLMTPVMTRMSSLPLSTFGTEDCADFSSQTDPELERSSEVWVRFRGYLLGIVYRRTVTCHTSNQML